MSLYLPEQKLGSHSGVDSTSNKFALKGRQTGAMHRGHNWVFRAESHETMMAWYDDIKTLTEQTPEERSNLVRASSRSISRSSQRSSVSSDGVDDDEEPPFTAAVAVAPANQQSRQDGTSRRTSGGRFPSDLQVNAQRGLQVPVSPLSVSSGYGESLNHHDPFVTTAHRVIDFEQQQHPHSLQEGKRARGAEQDDFHRAPAVDGLAGGPVQPPSLVVVTAAQRQSLQGPRLGENSTSTWQNVPAVDGEGGGPVWAEPVPIHVPARQLAAPRDTDSQGTATTNGSRSLNKADSRTSQDRGSERSGMDGAPVETDGLIRPDPAARTDSVPTLSHLHIPGEYPRTASGL